MPLTFGNVVINNYSASFAVGDIPRVDIEAECFKYRCLYTGSTYQWIYKSSYR